MGNCVIAYGNVTDSATLTGGSWRAALPLVNLKDARIKKVARSTDALSSSTLFVASLAASTYIGMLSLEGTNASPAAQVRWRTYSDSGLTNLVYDSGVLDVYPANTMPFGTIPWGAPNWWTGQPLAADVARFQNAIRHAPTTVAFAQYVKCEVFDTANSAGYFESGRLFVGPAFRPTFNYEYGASVALKSRTAVTRSRSGQRYYDPLRPDLNFGFALKSMTQAESQRWLDIQAQVDVSGEVVFMADPEDVNSRFKRSVFGQLAQLDPILYPFYNRYEAAFQIEGTL